MLSDLFLPEGLSHLGPNSFEGFLSVSLCLRSWSKREVGCAFCPRSVPWLKLQESPLDHCPSLLSTDSSLPLSSQR